MTATFFRVKNFERYQHYKDRSPPWIKLYNELLDDYEFGQLPDASKWHLIAIWLLASRSANKIPFDPAWVSKRINASSEVDLTGLVRAGFLLTDQPLPVVEHDASTMQAKCLTRERGETEGERERKEDAANAAFDPSIAEREFFQRGKQVCGETAGGMLKNLLKAKGGNAALARSVVEVASTKQNAREYVAAAVHGPPSQSRPPDV